MYHDGTHELSEWELEYYRDGPQVTLIPPDVRVWLETFVPNRWQTQTSEPNGRHEWMPFVVCYVFYRPQDAVLFKLTWGGKS